MSKTTRNRDAFPTKFKIGSRFSLLEEGQYRARVTGIRPASYQGKRDQLHFDFEIADGEYRGVVIHGFVNANYKAFSTHTKLFRWYSAAIGHSLDEQEEIDLENFYDRILLVSVKTTISTLKNKFSNVADVLRLVQVL